MDRCPKASAPPPLSVGGGALFCCHLSATTTPGYAGESKKNYIVKKPSGRMEVAVGQLQQQSPGVFFDERKRYWKFAAYDMEMSIPYRIRTQIQTVSDIWTNQEGYRTNSAEIV